ncbi:16S rRNA (cytidine(1402)-2'-O)-methyltransferase [Geobacter sulfurreducens]|uniref:Ribosomal RNA small subunit methyltransferase I n=1 Tax=Geobacter sulfurreducens (strain ATCC 51573 / DSM 12127 / PCA) TaxID=243231 RepID=Q74FF6_GEOSL|nr:16S rRNA (cytidine(1402)-2'-O)-methyltransferase [Geobacter sulfurreducens]AAR33983.1 16S rRNA (2'-O-methyl-C1402)-methyltransferase [Geobacter sulfurreducens PCA]ADI83492.1 16S rRNA (2'-O-methyl-C1402)-methyltransferase [Geobacter sulfurreducens KN400]AJY70401.1 tetrapyrrole methylase [Geobacter sulfurreducens]QVW35892.1 16S rRNA (cytidine(1402)-2'-O)-methyltransferase [Geobacter sulfurreducens]UAC04717.1 16S rRNA (cytidine(1402)-2'-O)-methyltransferase [Geobacter sulfurreducens]
MPGILYIIATPIGNLEDITYRAVRILGEVDLVAAEDTRHTRKLLSRYGITKPLTSYFDHNKSLKGEYLLTRLHDGQSVALVTDAGTPCISDPGYQLVRDAVSEGILVVPVPGPSAFVAALSAAGLPTDAFVFEGFLPTRGKRRLEKLANLKGEQRVVIFYEAPGRLQAALADMREVLGDRHVVVARELTKIHEEFVRGRVSFVAEHFAAVDVKGEVVILVAPAPAPATPGEGELKDLLRHYLRRSDISFKDAVKRVSVELDISRAQVYEMALKLKNDDESVGFEKR